MNAGSLFSGIGGMDHGLARAGFRHVFFCESDPWRRTVLEHHWPGATVYDDVRSVAMPRNELRADGSSPAGERPHHGRGSVDLLCGGFPCQDLSVAGQRRGLAGERSGLFHEFARIIDTLRPRWVLIENVPGLLSSNGGRDFGTVLGTLADIGYGVGYRVLDSRYFGVPQRRRRVFIVGALAHDDPRAAAERAGQVLAVGSRCPGHPPAGTKTRQDVAVASLSGLGTGGPDDNDGQAGRVIVSTLQNAGRHPRGVPSTDEAAGGQLVSPASYLLGQRTRDRSAVAGREVANGEVGADHGAELVGVASDFDGGEDHVGHLIGADVGVVGHVDVQVNEDSLGHGSSNRDGDPHSVTGSGANRKGWDGDTSSSERAAPVISFDAEMSNQGEPSEHAYLTRKLRRAISSEATGVRRLTPVECERLQALPDHWTAHGPDSRRYAALGDAVTSSVAEWIGRRILAVAA